MVMRIRRKMEIKHFAERRVRHYAYFLKSQVIMKILVLSAFLQPLSNFPARPGRDTA